jgi:DNA-binding CsgD family transcriptional regulator
MELLPTHPAFPHVAENPHAVIAISDCISQRELRRTALYHDILKPMDVAHQIVIGLQIPQHVAGVSVSRDKDFTDDERGLLRAIAPHLALAHIHAQNLTNIRQLESVVSPSADTLMGLGLSGREAEVLHWVIQGKRDAEIASILGVSPRTAQKHVQSVLFKLGVETRTAAALEALQRLRGARSSERQ